MNPNGDDPLIDALLQETLGGCAPPDLSARILQAWSVRSNGSAGHYQSSPDRPSGAPLNVFAEVSDPAAPPIVVGAQVRAVHDLNHSPGRVRPRRKDWSALQLWSSLGAAAAVLLIGFVGMQMSGKQEPLAQPDPGRIQGPIANNGRPKPANTPQKRNTKPEVRPQAPDIAKGSTLPTSPSPMSPSPMSPPPAPSPNEALPQRKAVDDAEIVAFINAELRKSWQEHGVSPSDVATEVEWCRRVYLRLIGRIPTIDELQAFADDKTADKHALLVDRLLGDDEQYAAEFARHWSDVFANVLIGRGLGNDPEEPASRAGLQEYLQASLRQNKPYDRMALELISATGTGQPGADNFNGAANFLLAHATDDATVATARTCRVFLGMQLQCVQCHDHPTASLQQSSFWAMNAFFRQMKVSGNRNDPRELLDQDYLGFDGRDDEGLVFFEQPNGLMKVAAPTFIDGTTLPKHSGRVSDVNRREQLASLIVHSKYFSQATVNRLWSQFLGFGFTRPIDDMVSQPASNPELLNQIAQDFADTGFDLKRAMRWIALSDAFNRSSKVGSGQLADMPDSGTVAWFSHYYTRQLPAEEVSRSLQIAAKLRRDSGSNIEQARLTWLANARKLGDDDAEGASPSIIQSSISQSPILMHATTPGLDNLLHSVIGAKLKFDDKVQHLFLAALSRKPSRQELEMARSLGGMNEQNEAAALEDIWWALLNSSEFALDH
jgi:hypothetical protein